MSGVASRKPEAENRALPLPMQLLREGRGDVKESSTADLGCSCTNAVDLYTPLTEYEGL